MATYEEVKDIPNHPEKYLVDVRNASELKETGVLPSSINIPCEQLYGSKECLFNSRTHTYF